MTGVRRVPYVTIAICVGTMAAIAAVLGYFSPTLLVLLDPARIGHQYYIPSESMLPTLEIGEHIDPLRVVPGALNRGSIIVFQTPKSTRIDRIAAIGGDMVALKDGVVFIDGKAAPQRLAGAGPTLPHGSSTRLLIERFPGEGHSHRLLDAGESDGDNYGPIRVPADTFFVLGDNRDRAADSRFPPTMAGVGMVRAGQVLGVADTISWSGQRQRIGRPIDGLAETQVARK